MNTQNEKKTKQNIFFVVVPFAGKASLRSTLARQPMSLSAPVSPPPPLLPPPPDDCKPRFNYALPLPLDDLAPRLALRTARGALGENMRLVKMTFPRSSRGLL